jgi:hypothetical protein
VGALANSFGLELIGLALLVSVILLLAVYEALLTISPKPAQAAPALA